MKEVQNVSKIRRHGLYGRIAWRFGIMIAMFMLVGIGYRFRSWFQTKIFKALKICHISYVIFEKPFRDIEYDLMTESTKIPMVKTTSPEENFLSEDVHEDTKGHKDHGEAKTENTPSQEDPDWSYTGSVWPMPKHQIFKALADILPIAAPKSKPGRRKLVSRSKQAHSC